MGFEELSAKLVAAGQAHVLQHWDELDEAQRTELEAQVSEIHDTVGLDLKPLLSESLRKHGEQREGSIDKVPTEWVARADGTDPESESRWEKRGLDAIARGECAACVMAGGMGTRLGSSFPKGMLGSKETPENFLPSHKSLFQIYAERVSKMQRRAMAHAGLSEPPTIWFLVMTVQANYHVTRDFFERHAFFGLRSEQVIFFRQGFMPCFGDDGAMLMETRGRICTSPNGNAGIYPALKREGVLEKMKAAGVQWVQVFSVDNVLVRVADPVWYGYCEEAGADVCVKTVSKRNWQEAVGVVTLRGGVPSVIEYTEIGDKRAQETDGDGVLKYNAANICLQAYSLDFLSGPALEYPALWHIAKKDIATVDGNKPGIKLEGFIFDPFEVAKNFRMLQVDRAAEFSAIKNASDSGKPDTPQTASASLSRLHRSWLRKAGARLPPDDADGNGPMCEISPLVSYRGEGLEALAAALDVSSDPIMLE